MNDEERTLWADVNGEVVPASEAKVSAWDRGFLFGDSVFEAVRIHHGRPVLWDVHTLRLMSSARGIRFENVPDPDDLLRRTMALIRKSGLDS
ncbi:MAG: aminodeoxychorismate lyase, partial [Deltaproteobacteria bacterium]|nr:aminodeoxychorismate lyase [Deltaproteobacteria bacterium]